MKPEIILSISIIVLYWIIYYDFVRQVKELRKTQNDIMKRLQSLDNMQTLSNLYMIRQSIDKNNKVTQSKFDDLLNKFYPEK